MAYFNTLGQIPVVPQINFTNYHFTNTDTFNYIKLSASYTAQGGERFLTIGNFDSIQNFVFNNFSQSEIIKDTVNIFPQFIFIDDVSLVEDSTSAILNPDLFTLGKDTVLCNNTAITLSAPLYYSDYLWNTGDTSRQINTNIPGIYWCSANAGCTTYSDTIQVSASTSPQHFISPQVANLCVGASIQLTAPPNYQYTWSTGDNTQTIQANQNQTYYCTISNACGYFTDSVEIKMSVCEIVLPNAFTPNGDGLNDEFRVISSHYPVENLSVYNRYGQKVFSYDGTSQGWDGKFKGKDCATETYFYICRVKANGQLYYQKGDVMLVR